MLLDQFSNHWRLTFADTIPAGSNFLLAVSGGVDSVVLLSLFHDLGLDFTILHCNFKLRGSESDSDESFVVSLGNLYNKKVLIASFDTNQFAKENKISIQLAARQLRYQWFESVQKESSANSYLVTAHHADDNIETSLMHFFRGTGINGISGIQPMVSAKNIIRPLLVFRKKALIEYAKSKGLGFVEDSSNASNKYSRNFIRNQVLPSLKTIYPQVEENILSNIEKFNEVALLYQKTIDGILKGLLETKGEETHIPVLKWFKTKPLRSITWEIIKQFGFHASQIEEVIKLLGNKSSGFQSSPSHEIIRNRKWMIIVPIKSKKNQTIIINSPNEKVSFEEGVMEFEISNSGMISKDPDKAIFSISDLHFPLILRKAKPGDYFYPFGMKKKKKINKFLIDLKLSKSQKDAIWVLESHQRICWVIGYRTDERFKVFDLNQSLLTITYCK